MYLVIGAVLSLVVLALAVGALTGRVRVRSCCAISAPERDLRMREAFLPPQAEARTTRGGDRQTMPR